MDIRGAIEIMVRAGAFDQVVGNPLAQLGTANAPYLFATIMPERPVPVNEYTEEGIRYRTVIANAGTRYSPVQIKKGVITGMMRVTLGNSDIGSELSGQDYDALIRVLERTNGALTRPTMEAATRIFGDWAEKTLNQPLLMHNELNRVNALVLAQVTLTGDNNYREVVNLPNPTGSRVTAGSTWSVNTNDPWTDIIARINFLKKKGYRVARIITSTDVLTILRNNDKVKARAGIISIASGTVTGLPGTLQEQQLNDLAQRDGIPPFEAYDRVYNTQTTYGYLLQRDAMIFVAGTGRDERIERGDVEPVVVGDTLGYTAVGRAAGQNTSGRVVKVKSIDDEKPPRVKGEAWQTSFPVLSDPEAVTVITGIA